MVVRGEREYWVPAVPQHLRRVDLRRGGSSSIGTMELSSAEARR